MRGSLWRSLFVVVTGTAVAFAVIAALRLLTAAEYNVSGLFFTKARKTGERERRAILDSTLRQTHDTRWQHAGRAVSPWPHEKNTKSCEIR